jgi:hypothetical protein
MRQDSWHLHTSQEARDSRWAILEYMVRADFYWFTALLDGTEKALKSLETL